MKDTRHVDAHIQTFDEVSIRRPNGRDVDLGGTSRKLLALLVAAGRPGLTLEDIATEFWPGHQPARWQASLEVAASRLREQLEPEFSLTEFNNRERLRLTVNQGWVDAWRLEELDTTGHIWASDMAWVMAGIPFRNVVMSPLLHRYSERLLLLQRLVDARWAKQDNAAGAESLESVLAPAAIQQSRRLVIVGPDRRLTSAATEQLVDSSSIATDRIQGSREIDIPLGAFALAMPSLRGPLLAVSARNPTAAAREGFRLVSRHIAHGASSQLRNFVVEDVDLLDDVSILVVSMLFGDNNLPLRRLIVTGTDSGDHPTWGQIRNADKLGDAVVLTVKAATQARVSPC